MVKDRFRTFWFLGLIILISISYLFFDYEFSYAHELAHKTIYSYYGINSKIKVRLFGDSYTEGNETQLAKLYINNPRLYSSMVNAESMVDAVGYHLSVLFDVLFFIMCVLVMMLFLILSEISDIYDTIRSIEVYAQYNKICDMVGGYVETKKGY